MQRLKQLATTGFIIAAVLSAVALYAIKLQARVTSAEVARLEQAIAAEEAELVVLKAELANRARPDRIAKLARQHLGMKPVTPAQMGSIAKLPWREGAVAQSSAQSPSP